MAMDKCYPLFNKKNSNNKKELLMHFIGINKRLCVKTFNCKIPTAGATVFLGDKRTPHTLVPKEHYVLYLFNNMPNREARSFFEATINSPSTCFLQCSFSCCSWPAANQCIDMSTV